MMYPYSSTQSFLNQLTNKTKQLLKKIREKSSVNDDQQIHWHILPTSKYKSLKLFTKYWQMPVKVWRVVVAHACQHCLQILWPWTHHSKCLFCPLKATCKTTTCKFTETTRNSAGADKPRFARFKMGFNIQF